MDESRVKELIKEALDENGAVTAAISKAIASALGELGAVKVHVQGALDSFLAGPVKSAIEHAHFANDFDAKADAEYPFRKILRAASAADMSAAWQSLMVDPDHIQSLCDGIQETGLATILALHATHPNNVDLQRLKHHASLKNAPRAKWKSLCLPERGGGSDRLRVFLLERAESSSDNLIKALARAILAMYVLVERRFTVSQVVKKNGPEKSEHQRQQLMPLVYECIKAFKRRTTKASTNASIDGEVLLRDFGMDIVMGEASLFAKGGGIAGGKRCVEASQSDGRVAKHPKLNGSPPPQALDPKALARGTKASQTLQKSRFKASSLPSFLENLPRRYRLSSTSNSSGKRPGGP